MMLFLGFDHIGGINTLLNALSIGAFCVALREKKDIRALGAAIEAHKVALLPANPSLLNLMLFSKLPEFFDLSSLKIITYGTEKMPKALLERLKNALPKVRFHQTFGTSETGIAQTKTFGSLIKLENLDYKIIDDELFIRSKTQSLGYLNAANDAFDADGYFATGDLVRVVEHGTEEFVEIVGRKKEAINVGGEKLLPQEVEEAILELLFVRDCVVFGEANALTGQSVSAKIALDPASPAHSGMSAIELKKQIRLFLKNKLAPYKIPTKIIKVDEIALTGRLKKARGGETSGESLGESKKSSRESFGETGGESGRESGESSPKSSGESSAKIATKSTTISEGRGK